MIWWSLGKKGFGTQALERSPEVEASFSTALFDSALLIYNKSTLITNQLKKKFNFKRQGDRHEKSWPSQTYWKMNLFQNAYQLDFLTAHYEQNSLVNTL